MSGNAAKTMWIAADNPEEPPIGLLGDPEREAHTVYVGNINRETPNEKIRELLMEAGTLVDFKMVWDKNTGLRTYGFAQYKDIESVQKAIETLNSREFDKRNLRVATISRGLLMEIPDPEAPAPMSAEELANQEVNSISPEQMYTLLLQMKEVIYKNPVEARKILLDQPQLAYALLQAQTAMRIVPPDKAMKMIHPSATEESRREARYQPRRYLTLDDLSKSNMSEELQREFLEEAGTPPPDDQPAPSSRPPPRVDQDPRERSQGRQFNETLQPIPVVKSEPVEDPGEKNRLVNQVLQLSQQQIDMLPPEQRKSVLQLKAQIQAQSQQKSLNRVFH